MLRIFEFLKANHCRIVLIIYQAPPRCTTLLAFKTVNQAHVIAKQEVSLNIFVKTEALNSPANQSENIPPQLLASTTLVSLAVKAQVPRAVAAIALRPTETLMASGARTTALKLL